MTDLRAQLDATLSGAYTIDRELGGGGMSRVFVAQESALGRRVVLKVLPAELGAGVSGDRFAREVRLAANLQHPCIVPVLAAGVAGDIPYYTMPLIEGESLRARLLRGNVAVGEAVKILRDMAGAMAYAHERGIVHRDIKPENVLLSGGYAVVSDFGIAKAVEGARTVPGMAGATITQLGVAIGTPAYMSPEQAAGDPGTDHRADVYAWGMVAYELLGGAHPFTNRTTAQALLAAQMSERPRPLAELRPDVPASIAALAMQCLEKDPAHRPQTAGELSRSLDVVLTPRSGQLGAMPGRLPGGRHMLVRALGIYVAAFVVAIIIAKAAIVGIGLPGWVLLGTVVVMAIGLPVILVTAYVSNALHRVATQTPTMTPGGTLTHGTLTALAVMASPHMSWRRTTLGGVWAAGVFVALVAGYMALRSLGIGPAGSLLAAGVINDRDQLLVADFSIAGGDSLLGRAVTEAIRTDLRQSDVMRLVPASVVNQMLVLMEKPATTPIDTGVARVIAARTGVKAILGGDIAQVGASYVLTARLIAPSSGDVLAAFRENASDQRDLLPAVERLSRSLRAKLGESLRRIHADPALTQVTTSSLEALRLYAQGLHVGDDLGDVDRGRVLLLEAVQRDSTFAMAWRKLGTWANNAGDTLAETYAKKAVDNSNHLTTRERYTALGSYYTTAGAGYDAEKAIAALRRANEIDSTETTATVNLAIQLSAQGQLDSAIVIAMRGARMGNIYGLYHAAALTMEAGRRKESDSLLAEAHRRAPGFPYRRLIDVGAHYSRGHYDSAEVAASGGQRASVQMARGRFRAATATLARVADSAAAEGNLGRALDAAATSSWIESAIRNRPAAAVAALDSATRKYPLDRQALSRRPYYQLAAAYAVAGRPDRAADLIRQGDQRYSPGLARWFLEAGAIARGLTALAEKRPRDAIAAMRQRGSCAGTSPRTGLASIAIRCPEPFLAEAYDQAGDADSARVVLERYVNRTSIPVLGTDALILGQSLQRLGELYEAKGDRASAVRYYGRLLALWKNADPELAPRVDDVRKRVAKLSDVERPR